MSRSAVRTGCDACSGSRVRRIGRLRHLEQGEHGDDPQLAAATVKAAPGLRAATTAPATAGPTAWPIVGRTMPSKPLTAWRSDSGTSAGSQAE